MQAKRVSWIFKFKHVHFDLRLELSTSILRGRRIFFDVAQSVRWGGGRGLRVGGVGHNSVISASSNMMHALDFFSIC